MKKHNVCGFFFFSKPNGYLHQTVHTFIAFHHFRIGFFNITHFLSFFIFSLISHLVDNNCIVKYCCCNLLPFTPAIRHVVSITRINTHSIWFWNALHIHITMIWRDELFICSYYSFHSVTNFPNIFLRSINQGIWGKKTFERECVVFFYDQCARKSSQWQKNKLELRWWR